MADTKEKILLTALRLFARDGYEAVSVSQIAGELGMVKSALYKHYKSKKAIFDSILERMVQMDYERASQYEMPEGTAEEMEEKYSRTPLETIAIYSEAQFEYWTEEEFASLFRRMLTLEQYRSPEMAQLYQQYLCSGPLAYTTDLFSHMTNDPEEAKQLALEFYSPMFMLYSLYDAAEDSGRHAVKEMLHRHFERFIQKNQQLKENN